MVQKQQGSLLFKVKNWVPFWLESCVILVVLRCDLGSFEVLLGDAPAGRVCSRGQACHSWCVTWNVGGWCLQRYRWSCPAGVAAQGHIAFRDWPCFSDTSTDGKVQCLDGIISRTETVWRVQALAFGGGFTFGFWCQLGCSFGHIDHPLAWNTVWGISSCTCWWGLSLQQWCVDSRRRNSRACPSVNGDCSYPFAMLVQTPDVFGRCEGMVAGLRCLERFPAGWCSEAVLRFRIWWMFFFLNRWMCQIKRMSTAWTRVIEPWTRLRMTSDDMCVHISLFVHVHVYTFSSRYCWLVSRWLVILGMIPGYINIRDMWKDGYAFVWARTLSKMSTYTCSSRASWPTLHWWTFYCMNTVASMPH